MRTAPRLASMIIDLSAVKNVSVNKLLQECNLNKSLIDSMKNGAMPSVDKIIIIADYLDVSVEYLMGVTNNPTPPTKLKDYTLEPEENSMTPKEPIDKEFVALLDRISEIPVILRKEQIEDVCEYVEFLIQKEQRKYQKRIDVLKERNATSE